METWSVRRLQKDSGYITLLLSGFLSHRFAKHVLGSKIYVSPAYWTCNLVSKILTTVFDIAGLPSQLRDAILSSAEGSASAETSVSKEYIAQQQLALIDSGNDPWRGVDTPNERMIKLARNAHLNREQPRVHLPSNFASDAEKSRKRNYTS